MLASARRRSQQRAATCRPVPACGGFVGRAISPAVLRLAAPQGLRGNVLPNFAGYLRRKPAMHPSVCAERRIHLPLQGRLRKRLPPKRLPCKGLRSRAPPAADTARRSRCSGRRMQARFSVRRMMRIPQTGNGVRRLRGAAPCPANTLPGCLNPPQPCGAALTQNHSVPPSQPSPAGVNARPTSQGKRAAGTGNGRHGRRMMAEAPST